MASQGAKTALAHAADEDACEALPGRILDGDAFLQRLEGDRVLAKELLALFEAHVPAQLEALRAALGARDVGSLEAAAHGIKGVLNNIHAERAAQAALRLECIGRSGQLQGADAAFEALMLQMQRLQPALRAFSEERLS